MSFKKMAHKLQGLGGLARPGRPHDHKLPTDLLVGGLDAEHLTRLGHGLRVRQLHQLRRVTEAEVHLRGMLD